MTKKTLPLKIARTDISQTVDSVTNDNKNQLKKRKVNFKSEPVAFIYQEIFESDSEPKLYGIESINLPESGKYQSNDSK